MWIYIISKNKKQKAAFEHKFKLYVEKIMI